MDIIQSFQRPTDSPGAACDYGCGLRWGAVGESVCVCEEGWAEERFVVVVVEPGFEEHWTGSRMDRAEEFDSEVAGDKSLCLQGKDLQKQLWWET